MSWFCKHDWKVNESVVLPSAYEQVEHKERASEVPWSMFEKKAIIIMSCKKCGKIDKTIERSHSF